MAHSVTWWWSRCKNTRAIAARSGLASSSRISNEFTNWFYDNGRFVHARIIRYRRGFRVRADSDSLRVSASVNRKFRLTPDSATGGFDGGMTRIANKPAPALIRDGMKIEMQGVEGQRGRFLSLRSTHGEFFRRPNLSSLPYSNSAGIFLRRLQWPGFDT